MKEKQVKQSWRFDCLPKIVILNIIVYKDFSLEKGLFWLRNLIMYKYKIFSLIFQDIGIAEW